MSGGQFQAGAALREDIKGMVEELKFEELGLMADKIAVEAPVMETAAAFPVLPREATGKVPDTRRKSDGSFARGEWEMGVDSYFTREYGFEEPIDLTSKLENDKWFDEEVIAGKLAVQALKLGREARVANAVMNETTFAGSPNFTSLTHEWDDAVNATPWADIDGVATKLKGKSGIQKKYQSLILTWDNIDNIIRCTEIKNHVQYVSVLVTLTPEQKAQWLATYFGVKEIVPVQSVYDAAARGVAFSYANTWSNEYGMLCVLDKSPSIKARTVAVQPVWSKYASDYIIESYMMDVNRKEIVRARENRDIKIRTDYGVLITNMKTSVSQGV